MPSNIVLPWAVLSESLSAVADRWVSKLQDWIGCSKNLANQIARKDCGQMGKIAGLPRKEGVTT